MVSLLRAEWQKSLGNYRVMSFLVWVYPVGITAFFTIMILGSLLSETLRAGIPAGSGSWVRDLISGWGIINAFPVNVFGRLLPLAYMAVVFAGEYEWGTWKLLIPRSRRPNLVIAKLGVLSALIFLALVLTTILVPIGQGLLHLVSGQPYGPAITSDSLRELASGYAREAGLAVVTLWILASFAALSAVLSRSMLGTLLLSFGFSIMDLLAGGLLLLIGNIFGRPEMTNLYQYSLTYNLDNLRTWLLQDQPLRQVLPGFTAEPGMWTSTLILALWLGLLLGLTLFLFQRQDITS